MQKTKIPWATHRWNPVTGCSPVSEGCQNCYAQRWAKRFKRDFEVKLQPERLNKPLKVRGSSIIFVNSMSDIFHENVPDNFILAIWNVMVRCPQHTFLILTKRPERAEYWMNLAIASTSSNYILPNVWLGVTAENQPRFNERYAFLKQIPAAKHFISLEPLLAPINLKFDNLDWVIVGGETGPKARECREEWVHGIYDQCISAQVPFFFKSKGKKWKPFEAWPKTDLVNKNYWEQKREWPGEIDHRRMCKKSFPVKIIVKEIKRREPSCLDCDDIEL